MAGAQVSLSKESVYGVTTEKKHFEVPSFLQMVGAEALFSKESKHRL